MAVFVAVMPDQINSMVAAIQLVINVVQNLHLQFIVSDGIES